METCQDFALPYSASFWLLKLQIFLKLSRSFPLQNFKSVSLSLESGINKLTTIQIYHP